MSRFTLVYHNSPVAMTLPLPAHLDEAQVVAYAQSESHLLHSLVSLWIGDLPLAAFDDSFEVGMDDEQHRFAQQAMSAKTL